MTVSREYILCKIEDHIAVITLNRPKALNAFSSQVMDELMDALAEAERDPDVYAIVINSAVDKAFTAGGDIKEESALTLETAGDFSSKGQACMMAVYNCDVPVVLAVNGYCLGGGLELVLAADITVAASTAKIGIPTINLGAIPCCTATQLLPRIVGHSRAADILLTGRVMDAQECYDMGLIEYVVEKSMLMEKAMEVAETIADKSPQAVFNMRKAIKRGLEMPLTARNDVAEKNDISDGGIADNGFDDIQACSGLELEKKLFIDCYQSADRREALDAFLEKRPHGQYENREKLVGEKQ